MGRKQGGLDGNGRGRIGCGAHAKLTGAVASPAVHNGIEGHGAGMRRARGKHEEAHVGLDGSRHDVGVRARASQLAVVISAPA